VVERRGEDEKVKEQWMGGEIMQQAVMERYFTSEQIIITFPVCTKRKHIEQGILFCGRKKYKYYWLR